ncbi:Mini-chromosome maintenance replisome factor, putative [Leishmania lindenbergi]|uniref:Mini-chromosome maintenance replisome factor n=1 Tax=Leishmania lindenbergi TaxID=651832 RepID=A0AAW3ABB9_9TRYP
MATQDEMEALLCELSTTTGTIAEAVRYAHKYLQSPECQSTAVDVFPPTQLAHSIGKLCRCRGMIQEVQPELHLFCASRQNFFSASSVETVDGNDREYMDAVSLYVIPVPGNLHFYTMEEPSRSLGAAHCDTLRKRSDRDRDASMAAFTSDTENDLIRKYARHTASASDTTASPAQSSGMSADGPFLNFPHPPCNRQLQGACVVTVLLPAEEGTRPNPFRINDVIDFYGYQHFPDDQLEVNERDDFAHFSAWNATELSRGLVSRLLCLSYAPVSSLQLRRRIAMPKLIVSSMAEARANAIAYLTNTVTKGDALTAKYLLLHLCARVRMHSASMPVGDLPLLISSPQLVAAEWSAHLREIVPVAEILLTGDVLRPLPHVRLTPKYNKELNYLEAGLLQVAHGTHITVDCASLGALEEKWYEGMFALIHKQQLLLEYPYQTLELPVDVSMLALHNTGASEALHPLFRFAMSIRWCPCPSVSAQDVALMPHISSSAVRDYLDSVRCLEATSLMDDALSDRASRALFEMSANLPGWNNRDPLLHNSTFSVAIALMRAHAASHGRFDFTAEDIAAVCALEQERMERLRTPPLSAPPIAHPGVA